ncbi:MAG: cellulose synthase catalytic subunit [Bacteroidales bacterium]|nr:cellulose synthase catalytic subunit [Bacteroidales bacterium]
MNQDLWKFREAPGVNRFDKFVLLIFILAGIISLVRFADWWFRREHIDNLWFFIIFSLVFWYGVSRLVLIWINYMNIKKPSPAEPEENLSVAIFTTCTAGEPLSMFEKTLAACRLVRYPHTTYLLTDRSDPEVWQLAERHDVRLLQLTNTPDAKAGKINRALGMTDEDFILILDPDHIPFPEFLDHTLGYFRDEQVGFVQVSQAYYNQYRSFTAKGAAEQTYTFYGPTQMGLHGIGSAVAIGANCTFRRKALDSIGGHATGLAEDMLTSVRLHASGWKSVYNPVIVSRGLVPEDFGSFCKQQLKWSRGVFEVAFVEIPKVFRTLTGWHKISYLTIGTYYLVGLTSFFFTLIPFFFFATGIQPVSMSFVDFIIHVSYVAVISMIIYLYVQRWMCHPETERGLQWRGMFLKYACYPVYLLGFLLALVNVEIPYIATAKKAVTNYTTPFIRPLLIQVILFVITFIAVYITRRFFTPESDLVLTAEKTWGMIGFAALAAFVASGGLFAAWESRRLKDEDPWDSIDIHKMK